MFSIFFWATSFTLPNALRAGGDAKFTMSVSIVSMWLFRVILSYIFVLQFHLGADRRLVRSCSSTGSAAHLLYRAVYQRKVDGA